MFSTPLLVYLGIMLLLVGLLGLYFTQKLNEQNHKISSMLGLVSTMAEELNYMRSRIKSVAAGPTVVSDFRPVANSLIPVSDDEESDDDDSSADDSSAADDSDSEHSLEEEPQIKSISLADIDDSEPAIIIDDIKTLNFNTGLSNEEEKADDDYDDDDEDDDSSSTSSDSIQVDSFANLKSISLDDSSAPPDYKNMPLNKLRNVAISKKLVEDASKLKKADILKLLNGLKV